MEEMKGKSNKCNIKSKKKQSKLAFVGNNKKIVYLSLEIWWGGGGGQLVWLNCAVS